MKTFFHPEQLLHCPRNYFSRGQLREPQELPERATRLVAAAKSLDFDVREPADFGTAAIAVVHDLNYLRFLEEAHAAWKKIPEDWGEEVMSNIYVREPNPLRGILAQAARYQADGSCPIGEHTWRAAYWSARYADRRDTTRVLMRPVASAT
jgi:acetoin utilization deacetylase AcuC-like enzyme